jgi:hypothetical protein
MTDEAKTTASCAMINRHGEIVTWQAHGDGICYVSDAPPSLDWIGVALAVVLIMIGILLVLQTIRSIGSKFWKGTAHRSAPARLLGADRGRGSVAT